MKRLTVHIAGAERKRENGKLKTFTTLSFPVANEYEANQKLGELSDKGIVVTKHSTVFIK